MDKAQILRECTRIEEIVTDAYNQHRGLNYYELKEVLKNTRSIGTEISEQPKTNGDRIRQMTDEELCEFLDGFLCYEIECCRAEDIECRDCKMKWLKQEVSEDAGTDD